MIGRCVVLLNAGFHDSLGAIRTTLPTVGTLGFTFISLACLSANAFTGKSLFSFFWHGRPDAAAKKKTGNPHLATAGGALGVIAAFGAFYCAMSLFWTQQTTLSYIRLPPLIIPPSNV
jgi:succinate-acetate transporter protein